MSFAICSINDRKVQKLDIFFEMYQNIQMYTKGFTISFIQPCKVTYFFNTDISIDQYNYSKLFYNYVKSLLWISCIGLIASGHRLSALVTRTLCRWITRKLNKQITKICNLEIFWFCKMSTFVDSNCSVLALMYRTFYFSLPTQPSICSHTK